jgi:hypothetical protein
MPSGGGLRQLHAEAAVRSRFTKAAIDFGIRAWTAIHSLRCSTAWSEVLVNAARLRPESRNRDEHWAKTISYRRNLHVRNRIIGIGAARLLHAPLFEAGKPEGSILLRKQGRSDRHYLHVEAGCFDTPCRATGPFAVPSNAVGLSLNCQPATPCDPRSIAG